MKVDFNTTKQNNFGMALHMNEAKIERKIGKAMADAARKVRPELEELAKDCDMYVKADKSPIYSNGDRYLIVIKKGLFNNFRQTTCSRQTIFNINSSFEKELLRVAKALKAAM